MDTSNKQYWLDRVLKPVCNNETLFCKASAVHHLSSGGITLVDLKQLTSLPLIYLIHLKVLHSSTSLAKALVRQSYISARGLMFVLLFSPPDRAEILLLRSLWLAYYHQKPCNLKYIKQAIQNIHLDERRLNSAQQEQLLDYVTTGNQLEFYLYLDEIFMRDCSKQSQELSLPILELHASYR